VKSSTRTDSSGFLVDTNILIYPHDPRDTAKADRAAQVLKSLYETGRGVVSVQCLSEFLAVSQRLPEPLSAREAVSQVQRLVRFYTVLPLTGAAVLEACRGVVSYRLAIWDALIWSVAKLNQVAYILTEDTEHGRFLEGVRYLNPFHPSFDLALLRQSP
jgi:predicted nucleic acid-binding protein